MAVSEKQRHELMKAMEGALGPEPAETLMNLLPPIGWADVATKSDLDHLRAATKSDLDHLRAATKSDLDHLRAATKGDLDRVAAELRAELERGLRQQLVTFLSANAVMLGIAVTLAHKVA
jgi:hypothetical protein